MIRKFIGTVTVWCAVALLAACGGGEEGSAGDQDVSSKSYRPEPKGESQGERIPEKAEPLDVIEGIELALYFDEEATLTELAVSPGDRFPLYVIVGHEEPYHVSAVEYRLELPEGVSILGEKKFKDQALTVGQPLSDFSMAFGCHPPGKYYLMKYECVAEENFAGGEVSLTPGLNQYGKLFLGVVSCKPETQKLPTESGKVVLTKK